LLYDGGNVVGLAAGDQVTVVHHHSIDPIAAGVANIGFQGRPRRERPIAHDVGLHQYPRAMANRRDGLSRPGELAHKFDRLLIESQRVGVDDPAGQQQGGKIRAVRLRKRQVGREDIRRRQVLPAAHAVGARRDQHGFRAGVV